MALFNIQMIRFLNQIVSISFNNSYPRLGYSQEICNGNNCIAFIYEENFNIKYWQLNEVIEIRNKIGFENVNTLHPISSADYIVK